MAARLGAVLLPLALAGTAWPGAAAEADERKPADIIDVKDVMDWILQYSGSSLYPSQFGHPGWPGLDPSLEKEPGYVGNNWGWPEMTPYPGSVEHIRLHRQRYLPVYPLYNARTLVKNVRAAEIPGIDPKSVVPYAEPVYHVPKYLYPDPEIGRYVDALRLDKYNKPVQTLRFDKSSPAITLDLGTLKPSAYAVRIIAAIDTEKVQQSTKRLVIQFEVNDGPNGETALYRKRCAANDQFYSMAEFFFIAPAERPYRVKIRVEESSELSLYVYNIDVHDRLAELPRKAAKRTASLYDEKARAKKWQAAGGAKKDPRTRDERFSADKQVMDAMLPANSQPRGDLAPWWTLTEAIFRLPADRTDDGMGIDLYGSDMIWNIPASEYPQALSKNQWFLQSAVLVGEKWKLQRQTYYEKAKEIGLKLKQITAPKELPALLASYSEAGDEKAARAASVLLARVALAELLNLNENRQTMASVDAIPELGPANQGDTSLRRRAQTQYGYEPEMAKAYDALFPYIRGNSELAESLGRFIPWIKSADDMTRFFELALIQIPARETMLYNRQDGFHQGAWMTTYIVIQQDEQVVTPWMHWLFRFVYAYPCMPTGIDETLFTSWNHDGTTLIASTFYTIGTTDIIQTILASLEPFAKGLHARLVSRLNLPEILSRHYWESRFSHDAMVAGGYRFWVGDVSGPSRGRWVVSGNETEADKVDAHNPSRVLANWFAILESNVAEPDFRKRRATGIRVGNGLGHAHADPLDLQIWGLGVPLAGDWGARPGYCDPDSTSIEAHNTVLADSLLPASSTQYRWISAFAATPGAQYLRGQVLVPGLYSRQLALVDIPDRDVSYVVDVFRVQGGTNRPSYAFHGPPPDEFFTNIEKLNKGWPPGMQAPQLDPENNWYGAIDDAFTASWMMGRDDKAVELKPSADTDLRKAAVGTSLQIKDGKLAFNVPGAERKAMGRDFNPSDPRKYIQMHLLGHGGATAFGRRGIGYKAEPFINDMVYVTPAEWKGQTVFPVVFEPYAGERTMRRVRLLTPKETLGDAAAPVAIEVTLANGRRDVIYSALPGGKPFEIPGVGQVEGEYAFLSWDDKGLRQATLVGGTLLSAAPLTIGCAKAAYAGTILECDPTTRTLTLSDPLPKEAVGDVMATGYDRRPTSSTIAGVNGARATLLKDFTLTMSRISGFLDEDGMPYTYCKFYIPEGIAVSNEKRDKWWLTGKPYDLAPDEKPWPEGGNAHPVEVPPKGRAIRLESGPEPKSTLKAGERLWAYEFGKSNAYRLPVKVNVVRGADGTYTADANIDAVVTVAGKNVKPKRK